jgi:hypothetical protein
LFRAFVNGGELEGVRILQASTLSQMTTLQVPDLSDEVGLHLFLMDAANNIWGHDGGEEGVSTYAGWNPTTKKGVIILCNASDAKLEGIFERGMALGKN